MERRGDLFVFLVAVLVLGVFAFLVGISITGNVIYNPESFIKINNCSDLQSIKNNLSGNFILNKDINCIDTSFDPIGNFTDKFTGVFYGNGHIISNISIVASSDDVGIFGYTDGATFANFSLYNISVEGNGPGKNIGVFGNILNSNFSHINASLIYVEGKNMMIGFVGYSNGSNFLNIELNNVTINGIISYSKVGGLVGNFENGMISNIEISNSSIHGKRDVGGAVGYYNSPGKISNSIKILNSNISVNSSNSAYMGGLIGTMYSGNIVDSFVYGGIINSSHIDSKDVGGLVGQLSNLASISNSYSNVTIQNYGNNTGGIIGTYNSISGKEISRLYSLGKIVGNDYVGGVIGHLKGGGELKESYSESNIVGKKYVGGIAGLLEEEDSRILSTSYNGTINGTENVGGLVGLNNGYIVNSYSNGVFKNGNPTTCTTSSKIGGVAGSNDGNIENSYSTMEITACNYVGGLVGYNGDDGKVSNSFYTGSISNNNKTFVIGRVNGSTALGKITKLYYYNDSTKSGYKCYANYSTGSSYVLTDDHCSSTKILDDFNNYSSFGNNQYISLWNDLETWGYFIYDNIQLPKFYWQSQCFEDIHCMKYSKTSDSAKSCYNSFCIDTTPVISVSNESPRGNEKLIISELDTKINLFVNTLKLSKIVIDANFGDLYMGECEVFGGSCSSVFNFRDNFNEGLIYGFSFEDNNFNFLNGRNTDISLSRLDYVDGRYGKSIHFTEGSEAIIDSDTLSNFTIVFWLKPMSVKSTETILSRKEHSTFEEDFSLEVKNESSEIKLYYNIGSEELVLPLSVNKWNFIALDFNGTTSTLYVHNGTINSKINNVSKNGITRVEEPGFYKIFLGNEKLSNSSIDEFRLYNKSDVNVEDIFYMGLKQSEKSDWDWEYTFHKKLDVGTYNYKFEAVNDVGQRSISDKFFFSVVNFLEGNGSIDNPFQISNCENLKKVNDFLSSNFVLLNDINCTGINYFGIGNDTHSFNATFDGNGYKIFGLEILSSEDYSGLFRKLEDSAYIYDLTIEDSIINGTKYVGCLYGYSLNGSSVENVTCKNVTIVGSNYTGGFAGYSNSLSKNVKVLYSNIIGANNTGGLFGYSGNVVRGSRVENTIVNGTNYIGGLVGINNNTISSTFVSNTVLNNILGKNNVSGGVVGLNKGMLTDSFFSGEVRGVFDIGGLVGVNNGTVFDSYSNASIFCQPCAGSDKMTNSGGIAGKNYGNIYNVFSVSYVNVPTTCDDSNLCAGLIGFNNGTILNSYWLNDTLDNKKAEYLSSYCNASNSCMSNDYIKIEDDINYFLNYTNAPMNHTLIGGWDFNNIWSYYNSGVSLPLLKYAFECVNDSHCLDSEHCISGACISTVPKMKLDPLYSTEEGARLNLSSDPLSVFVNISSSKLGSVSATIGEFNIIQDLFGPSSDFFDPKRVDYDLLSEHLILGISFDNNSIDSFVGDDYNGTDNYSLFVPNGKYGGARSFNGINASIVYPEKHIPYYENLSIFTWVNWEEGNKIPIIGDEEEKWGIGINQSGNVYYKVGNDYFYSDSNIINKKWNFVGVLLEEGVIYFYINGKRIDSIEDKEISGNVDEGSIPVVGKFSNNYANGTIDEILVFNKTLNSEEILMLYTSRLSWDGNNSYLLALTGNELNYISIPDGKQTLKVTACNDRGACSSLTRNYIIETESVYTPPTSGGSGSGGGGGDSYEPGNSVYSISDEQLSKGHKIELRVGDKFYFNKNNQRYHFTLIDNVNNSTELRLSIPYKIFNFSLSEEKFIDLTENGYSDVSIKLQSTNSTHASFLVKYSSMLINPPSETNGSSGGKEDHQPPADLPGEYRPTEPKEENPDKKSDNLFNMIGILLGVIILVIVAVIVISIRKKKIEEERKKKTQRLPPLSMGGNTNAGTLKKPTSLSPNASTGMKMNIPLPQKKVLKGQRKVNVPQSKNVMPPINKPEVSPQMNRLQLNDAKIIKDINALILKTNARINQGNLSEAKMVYKQLNEKYNSLSKHNENIYKKILELYENFKK